MKTAFTYIHFVAAMLALIFLSGCRKEEGYAGNGGTGGGTEEGKPGVTVPEAPEEIVEGNVFVVDFFSDLEGGSGFFDTRDWNLAAGHILAQSGKRPVVYMFDGTGFSAGEVNPALRIANNVKGNAFFAQSEATSDHVDGTGIVTLYQISDYDGIVSGSTFMSGCTIPVPLTQSTPICIFTSTISSAEDVSTILNEGKSRLYYDAVLVGTVSNGVREEVEKYLQEDGGMIRYTFHETDGKSSSLAVIVPASFVCRDISFMDVSGFPCYRVSVEKLEQL